MYNIKVTTFFERNLKKLSKKYPRVKQDYSNLLDQLENGIFFGDEIKGFSNSVYKVRVGSSDQKKGKQGGFRVIYYVVTQNQTVFLLTIYSKAMKENITDEEIKKILSEI